MFQYNKKKSANLQKLLFLFSRLCKSSRLELKNGFRGIKVQAELKPCVNKYETRNVAMLIFPFRAANGKTVYGQRKYLILSSQRPGAIRKLVYPILQVENKGTKERWLARDAGGSSRGGLKSGQPSCCTTWCHEPTTAYLTEYWGIFISTLCSTAAETDCISVFLVCSLALDLNIAKSTTWRVVDLTISRLSADLHP